MMISAQAKKARRQRINFTNTEATPDASARDSVALRLMRIKCAASGGLQKAEQTMGLSAGSVKDLFPGDFTKASGGE